MTLLTPSDELLKAGTACHRRGDLESAARHYGMALREDPDHVTALLNMADIEIVARHFRAGLTLARRAAELSPDEPMPAFQVGRALFGLMRYEEADAALSESCVTLDKLAADCEGLNSSAAVAWHMRGLVARFRGDFSEAMVCFERARIRSGTGSLLDHIEADRTVTLLAAGRWAEGLAAYEGRWSWYRKEGKPAVAAIVTEWRGEPLEGKTIALIAEQGFGDTIMLCRFVRNFRGLVGEAGKIVLLVPIELWRLMDRLGVDGVECVTDECQVRGADYWSPLFSAWRWLSACHGADLGASRYLTGELIGDNQTTSHDDARRRAVRSPTMPLELNAETFWMGIVWAGRSDENLPRSCGLNALLPLAEIPDTSLISLQMGEAAAEIGQLGAGPFIYDDAIKRVGDFEDTARIVEQLDLVVTIDTSVAHLCGALGVPCWVILDYPCAWQWMTGVSSPWYQSMRLFHAASPGDFAPVVGQICVELGIELRPD